MKLLLLRGLPGSGKTTYAENLIKANSSWKRVSKDMLRDMLSLGQIDEKNEFLLNQASHTLIIYYLTQGFNVVSDNMNLDPKQVQLLVHKTCMKLNTFNMLNQLEIEVKEFYTSLEECIERDSLRPMPVNQSIIEHIHEKWFDKDNLMVPLDLRRILKEYI